ncbi:MAG: tetratricopeptide repeat protein, partial [Alphaproteobacteria bacterium]|nr:tetratricopeptide repeat protein [Alphaproteobacteria bacterium]
MRDRSREPTARCGGGGAGLMATVSDVLASGLALQRAGEEARAARVYRQVLAFDPHQADALHLLGTVERDRGNLDEAARLVERAIVGEPTRAPYYVTLSQVLLARDDIDRALALLRRAAFLDPADGGVLGMIGVAQSQAGNHGLAVPFLSVATSLAPDRADLFLALGEALRFSGRSPQAVPAYERALALGADARATLERLALAHWAYFAFEPARAAYRAALTHAPDDASLHDQLGAVLLSMGDV